MADNIFTVKQNDRLPSLVIIARDNLGPVDLSGYTATFRAFNVLTGETKINAAATIATDPTFTASGATLTLSSADVRVDQDVTLKSTGALPGGLSASKKYFVVSVVGTAIKLSEAKGGAPITTTSAGTGTHTLIVGAVTYDWSATDTDTPGTYHAQIEATTAGKRLTFPNDSNIVIEVLSDLSENSERTVAIVLVMDRVQPNAAPKLRQAQIELEVDRALLAATWQANTFYPAGVEVLPPVRNGYAYLALNAGTSRATAISQSDWQSEPFESFSDGHSDSMIEWENVGSDRYNEGITGVETNPYDINRAARACWLIKAQLASQMIDDGDLRFSQLHEQCINHAASFQPFQRAARFVRAF